MSPLLYNVYTDLLNIKLTNTKDGCELNGSKINCLRYADDLVLMAPSAAGLQSLVDISESFASDHDITFNENKSKCLLFCPRVRKLQGEPRIMLILWYLKTQLRTLVM